MIKDSSDSESENEEAKEEREECKEDEKYSDPEPQIKENIFLIQTSQIY